MYVTYVLLYILINIVKRFYPIHHRSRVPVNYSTFPTKQYWTISGLSAAPPLPAYVHQIYRPTPAVPVKNIYSKHVTVCVDDDDDGDSDICGDYC
jgi:hypothetical protein